MSRWLYSFINTHAHRESDTYLVRTHKDLCPEFETRAAVDILGEDGSGVVSSPCKVTGKLLPFRLFITQRISSLAVFIRGGIKDLRVSLVFPVEKQ